MNFKQKFEILKQKKSRGILDAFHQFGAFLLIIKKINVLTFFLNRPNRVLPIENSNLILTQQIYYF